MRDLVVDDGEGLGIEDVEGLDAGLILELEPVMLAEDLIQRDGPVDGSDGVFGNDDDVHAAGLEEIGEVTDERVDVALLRFIAQQ